MRAEWRSKGRRLFPSDSDLRWRHASNSKLNFRSRPIDREPSEGAQCDGSGAQRGRAVRIRARLVRCPAHATGGRAVRTRRVRSNPAAPRPQTRSATSFRRPRVPGGLQGRSRQRVLKMLPLSRRSRWRARLPHCEALGRRSPVLQSVQQAKTGEYRALFPAPHCQTDR